MPENAVLRRQFGKTRVCTIKFDYESRKIDTVHHQIFLHFLNVDFEIRNANLTLFEKNMKKPSCRAQKVRK